MTSPTGIADDVVWIDVLPSLSKFNSTLRAQSRLLRASGVEAGASFGGGFEATAAKSAEAAALKVSAATKKVADSNGKLSVAQSRLTELQDKGQVSASRLAAAQESVAAAQRNVKLAEEQAAVAGKANERAQAAQAAAARATAGATATATARMRESSVASRLFAGSFGVFKGAAEQVGGLAKSFAPFIVGGAIYEAVKGASSFNAAMLRIQTQAGATSKEIAKFKPAILSMASKTVTQSPEDLATSLYHVYSTGLKGAKALDVVQSSAKFATVANADLEETTNALTATVASGIGGFKGMDQAVAALNTTVGAGDMKLSDLNEALGTGFLARVKLFGVNITDVGAALATFGDNNVRGADAATMLRTAVEGFAKPVKGGAAQLKALGMSADQMAKDMQTGGLNKAVTDLKEHLDKAGITGDKVGAVLLNAFGKKAGGGVALLVGQYDRLESKYAEIKKSQSGFSEEWAATQKTAAFAFASLKSTLEVLSVRIGEALLPILSKLATKFGSFLNQVMDGKGPAGKLAQAFKDLASVLGSVWSQLKGPLLDAFHTLGTVVGALVSGFAALAHWIKEHQTLTLSLAAAVGVLVAAYKVQVALMSAGGLISLIKSMRLVVGITRLWAAAQAALDIVMNANPIGIVIVALAALAAGFAYAWTHSKAFRDAMIATWDAIKSAAETVWNKGIKPVIDALVTAWDAVVHAFGVAAGAIVSAWNAVVYGFQWAWQHILKPVWDALGIAVQAYWDYYLHPIFTAIVTAWDALCTAVKWAWDHILHPVWNVIAGAAIVLYRIIVVTVLGLIEGAWWLMCQAVKQAWEHVLKPVWNAIATAANWLWSNVLQPIWAAMQVVWSTLLAAMQWVWQRVLQPTWNAIAGAASWLYNTILLPIWRGMQAAWSALLAGIQWVWQRVLQPTWNAIAGAASWLWGGLKTIWSLMQSAWSGLMSGMRWVYDHVLHPMWKILTDAVGAVQKAFETVVTGIGTAWDTLKAIVATPINFVIEVIFNRGLFTAWNWVVDHLGLPKNWHAPHWKQIPFGHQFADGGQVPGFAGGGEIPGPWKGPKADNVLGLVPTGRGTMPIRVNPREWIIPVGPSEELGPQRMDAIRTGRISREGFDLAMALTGGGQIPGFIAGGQVTGVNPSGFTWQQLNSLRQSWFPGSVMTSGYRPGASDYHGRGQAIDIGWPGNNRVRLDAIAAALVKRAPNSAEIIHNPNASVKDGRQVPSSFWGAATWAAHANHVHWAANAAQLLAILNGTAVGGLPFGSIADVLGKLKGSIGAVGQMVGQFGGNPFVRMLTSAPGHLLSGLWDAVKGEIGKIFASVNISGSVEPKGDVQNQVNAVARLRGWGSGSEWASTDYIVSHESGWNPTARNPHSSASGLFQQIDGTWMRYRGNSPYTRAYLAPVGDQARAGFGYIADRYHDPNSAANYWRAYHSYAGGGPVEATLLDTGGLWPPGLGLNMTDGVERVLSAPQDNMTQRLVDATIAAGGQPSGPSSFVGELYLDSGEFLGKVRGVATDVLDRRDRVDGRNLRSAR